jgi:hypothetical protein
MSTLTLDAQAIENMQADMNAKTSMLTDEQLNALAQKINSAINIPILGEKAELVVFAKIIKLIDAKLYELLPNEYYELINSMNDGISEDDATMMTHRLTRLLNERINIPFISEQKEEKLISLVIGYIVGAMVKGTKLVGEKLA